MLKVHPDVIQYIAQHTHFTSRNPALSQLIPIVAAKQAHPMPAVTRKTSSQVLEETLAQQRHSIDTLHTPNHYRNTTINCCK
jgi:DNA-binding transcriptional regulator YdaS (Cro superfamily)